MTTTMTMIERTTPRVLRPALLALLALLAAPLPTLAHEVHQSMTVADFDEPSRTLQVMIRLESDGLEEYLESVIKEPVIVENPDVERHVAQMVGAALRIANPDNTIRFPEWVGMENEAPWTYVYVQFPIPRKTEGLRLSNAIYFDHAEDQVNIVNVQVEGATKTLRFHREDPWQPLELPQAKDLAITPITDSKTMGAGPIQMVLIPTHNCDWSIYQSFMERNADRYTMHAVTLPGIAGTKAPPKPLRADGDAWIDNAVDATLAFIRQRGLDRPVILGHGLGGIVAYRLAADHPEACGPLITLDAMPAPLISKEPIDAGSRQRMIEKVTEVQIRNASDEQWNTQHRKLAASILVDEARRQELVAIFERTPPDVGKEYYIEHLKTDLTWRLPDIESRTLVIGSVNNLGASMQVFAADVEKMWRALFSSAPDNVRLVLWKDTGQFITEERPQELDKAVAEFLARGK
jgi:pimeloyl-ACP methyl ester carboxylesterase